MNYHNEFLKKINAKEKQRKEEQNQALKEKENKLKKQEELKKKEN